MRFDGQSMSTTSIESSKNAEDPTNDSKDHFYMRLAGVWAERSTCFRGSVGCVFIDDSGYVLSSGYNGAPRGLPHCTQVGCLEYDGHCVRSVHAEMNAIVFAARQGVSLVGSRVFTTTRPCIRCTVMLIQVGVKEIIWRDEYLTESSVSANQWLGQAGIVSRRLV